MGHKLTDDGLELYRRVDEVLFYVWDPIGVANSPAARDEYYGYLWMKGFAALQHADEFLDLAHACCLRLDVL